MKPLAFVAVLALSVGCAGSDTKRETVNTKAPEGEMVQMSNTACSEEIALDCAEGSVDGCGIQNDEGLSLTSYHICVPEGETYAGTPCEQEIARECDEGFVDACGLSPAASAIHACVAAPAATDEAEVEDEGDLPDETDDEASSEEEPAEETPASE